MRLITKHLENAFGFMLERERQSLYLLAPIALGCGVLTFFKLENDPGLIWPSLLFILTTAGAIAAFKYRRMFLTAMALCLFCGGIFFGSLRAELADTITLKPIDKVLWVRADVERLERREDSVMLLLKNVDLWRPETKSMAAWDTPQKIRVTARTKVDENIRAGDRVAFKAMLNAPAQKPVYPGGYDFARIAYFQNIGAVGYSVTPVKLFKEKKAGWVDRFQDHFYETVNKHVKDKDTAGIIVSQITADRVELSREVKKYMQNAGLSHLIAISGMNMSVAMLWVLLMARFALAAFPALALRYDTKKISCVVAIFFGIAYLLVTGMPVSAVRAFLMVLLFFIAVLSDRFSISLHPVAFAAMVILVIRPENIISPGFQLSFAAVIVLIGIYEIYEQYLKRERSRDSGFIRRWLMAFAGITVSTFFIGLVTAPFGILHFGTFQNYGVFANMVGIPAASGVVLPFAFLSIAAMPLGLEKPFLIVASIGAEVIKTISIYIGSKPGSISYTADIPQGFIYFVTAGFLIFFMFKTKLRLAGVPLIIAGYLMIIFAQPDLPDVVVNESGSLVALKTDDGYKYIGSRRDSFAQYQFNSKLGVEQPDFVNNKECNRKKCVHGNVAIGREWSESECGKYEYMVNLGSEDLACDKAIVINKATLKEKGTHLIYAEKGEVISAADGTGKRVWNRR